MSKRNINSELSNVFASTYISVAKADTVTSRVVILQNTMFPETEGKSFDLNLYGIYAKYAYIPTTILW